jgi:hypothetical protein
MDELKTDLSANAIPENLYSKQDYDYQDFLLARRKLMAKKIKQYYFSL